MARRSGGILLLDLVLRLAAAATLATAAALVTAPASATAAAAEEDAFVLGGYLPEYRDYIDLNRSAALLTDLYLFSVAPAPGGGDRQLEATCCLGARHYALARQARASRAERAAGGGDDTPLRVWLTVGGAGRSEHFLADPDGLAAAVRRVAAAEGLDGVVLDCEQFGHEEDYRWYADWIVAAAPALRRDGIAVAVTLHVGQLLPAPVYEAVDQVHLMAYDLHGAYHADLLAVKAGVGKLLAAGCPARKVVLGVPAYARHARRPGDVKTFAEIVDEIEESQSRASFDDAGYWKGFRGESTLTAKAKVAWARQKGLGGVFLWELGQDKQHPTAPGGLLLEAAATAVQETAPRPAKDEL